MGKMSRVRHTKPGQVQISCLELIKGGYCQACAHTDYVINIMLLRQASPAAAAAAGTFSM